MSTRIRLVLGLAAGVALAAIMGSANAAAPPSTANAMSSSSTITRPDSDATTTVTANLEPTWIRPAATLTAQGGAAMAMDGGAMINLARTKHNVNEGIVKVVSEPKGCAQANIDGAMVSRSIITARQGGRDAAPIGLVAAAAAYTSVSLGMRA